MQLKKYQNNAIKKLLDRSKELLNQSGNKKLIFKSPTGSGKTIMMAEFLKQLSEDKALRIPLAFIWTAPRKLHEQSKEKLEIYFESSRALECSNFEDLTDRQIQENEILFFNWESINKRDNVYIRDNERENNLSNILERTGDAGLDIVLIIDESHHHATSEISRNLIRDIAPSLTMEVSATPVMENPDEIVSVPLEDVKVEGMIKKSVVLNPDFQNLLEGDKVKSKLSESTDTFVLDQALKKLKKLRAAYKKEGVNINPLLLIQLPDRRTQIEDQVRSNTIRILKEKHNITVENGKLAIYLSEDKQNLENISRLNNEAQALIFKQAIALGWDCPRAHILVLFRIWRSRVFSIQTVGRIMRMPEPDKGHYETEILNQGYVFTNLETIEIQEDIAKDYVTIYTSHRIKKYKPIKLSSVHRRRHREKTRLSPLFIPTFLQKTKSYQLAKKIKTKNQTAQMSLISEWQAGAVNALAGQIITADIQLDRTNPVDLQRLFDIFVRTHLTPFYPEDRSIGRVKESIYRFFDKELKMPYEDEFENIVNIALSKTNTRHFINVLGQAKDEYIKETQKRDGELAHTNDWEIPKTLTFGGNYKEVKIKNSAQQPFYCDTRWKPETAFIDLLKSSNNVEWWFKNGERDAIFFAVEYKENGEEKLFYVDFIVKLKDGRLGLFDTKSGRTIRDAGPKSDGLQEYIKAQNKKGKKLFGGIAANRDSRNFTGAWMVYNNKGKDLKSNNFTNWEPLEL